MKRATAVLSAVVVGTAGMAVASPEVQAATCVTAGTTVTCTYGFAGGSEQFTVPDGVTTVNVVAKGAAGGTYRYPNGDAPGGLGGLVTKDLTVSAGQVLTITVGGTATIDVNDRTRCYPGVQCIGGFNGGGTSYIGAGGGGASDVRVGGTSLADRVIVAAGGGGGAVTVSCGSALNLGGAGGNAGQPGRQGGTCGSSPGGLGGGAGTQTAGGAAGSSSAAAGTLGEGGDAAVSSAGPSDGGGGGGGGLYGGGGGGRVSAIRDANGNGNGAAGGGGGGSNFPAGTATTTDPASVVISYTLPPRAPGIQRISNISVNADLGACSAANVAAPSISADGVPVPTVLLAPAMPATFPVGTTTVGVTATNGVNPDATASFTVQVIDNQAPTIQSAIVSPIVVDATSDAGAAVTFDVPTPTDNCPGPMIARTAGGAPGSTFPIGDTTVTYRATDTALSTSDFSFVVRVRGVAPTIATIPTINLAAASGVCSATASKPTVTTGGFPTPTVSFSPNLPGTFPVGTTSVTAAATNGVLPDATTTFGVKVSDTQAPTIVSGVANPLVVDATSPSGATVSYATPTANDNCPGVLVARTAGPASGSTFPVGDTVVQHTATDTASLTASVSFTVRVRGTSEQVSRLRTSVNGVSPGSAMSSKLADVQNALARNDKAAACRSLSDFINLVNAQRNKKISNTQATAWIGDANRIRAVIGC